MGYAGIGPRAQEAPLPRSRRDVLRLGACVPVLPATARMASAQAYPSRPVRIVVGVSAGSAQDTERPRGGPLTSRSLRTFGFGSIVDAVTGLPLVDARRLAATSAQIIELGAAHLAAAHDLDRVDHRRIERKHALDALAIRDLANREVLIEARAGAADADALVGLDAALLALDYLVVDEHGIARLKIRNLLAGGKLRDLLLLELLDQIHGKSPSAAPRKPSGPKWAQADERRLCSSSCPGRASFYDKDRLLSRARARSRKPAKIRAFYAPDRPA